MGKKKNLSFAGSGLTQSKSCQYRKIMHKYDEMIIMKWNDIMKLKVVYLVKFAFPVFSNS